MAEFDGIVQQIVKYLLNLADICIYKHLISGKDQFNSNGLFPAGAFKGSDCITDNLIDIKDTFI